MKDAKERHGRAPYIFMHNVEVHNLYSSPDIIVVMEIERMRSAGHEARMGEMSYIHTILV
jgi:hypothetical protein